MSTAAAVCAPVRKPAVVVLHAKAITTSASVAEYFNKDHKNVIRDIRALMSELSADFNALNFEPVEYRDEKGEMRPSFNMTRDGFTLLAMGSPDVAFMVAK